MTGDYASFRNNRCYTGTQHIQIANGNTLPFTVVGDIESSFDNVFMSLGLSTNLISVG